MPPQQVGDLKDGAKVEVRTEDSGGVLATGRITAINPVVDMDTRSVQIQATIRNPEGKLRPGMFVTAHVTLGEDREVVALPLTAINYAPYGNSVFIIEDIDGPDGKRTTTAKSASTARAPRSWASGCCPPPTRSR